MSAAERRRGEPLERPQLGKALRRFWLEFYPQLEVLTIGTEVPESLSLSSLEKLLGLPSVREDFEIQKRVQAALASDSSDNNRSAKVISRDALGKRERVFFQNENSEGLDILLTSKDKIKTVEIHYEKFNDEEGKDVKERTRFDYFFRDIRQHQIELTKYTNESYELYGLHNPATEEKAQTLSGLFGKNDAGILVVKQLDAY